MGRDINVYHPEDMLKPEEIEEEVDTSHLGISVLTPGGRYRKVLRVFRSIPLPVWEISLISPAYTLRASSHHLLAQPFYRWKPLSSFRPFDLILLDSGVARVREVKDTGEKENLYDLELEDEDASPPILSHAYITHHFISHNSTTFAARQMAYAHLIPGYRSLYVAPHHTHLETYCNRYAEMEEILASPVGHQLKGHKEYGRSVVEMIYCGENSLNARGKTVDEVLLDEAQSFDSTLLEDVLYTQTTSKMPTTIFAGTAMSIDTLLEEKWQDSSMGVWHCRAGDGRSWLNMYDKDTLFAVCSKAQGPTCPITGKLLDVSNGEYVHANRSALAQGRVGIHVPQCIITDLANSPIQWGKIYDKVKRTDPSKVMQECFGIAVANGEREITREDLLRLCTSQDTVEVSKAKCRKGYYRLIVSGCDWGGSDYNVATKTKQSYTVHCILGLAPDGVTDILHYYRYSGMDYESIANRILKDHEEFNGHLIATDFGVGAVYNMQIRKKIPFDRHFIMTYVGPKSAALAEPKQAHLPNQLSLNKTEAISAVFSDVKHFAPQRIRAKKWEEMRPYLEDWLNLFRAPSEVDSGETRFKYIRAATKPDDALHAFTFAYVLIKFYMGEPLVKDPTLSARLRQLMNHPNEETRPAINLSDFIVVG